MGSDWLERNGYEIELDLRADAWYRPKIHKTRIFFNQISERDCLRQRFGSTDVHSRFLLKYAIFLVKSTAPKHSINEMTKDDVYDNIFVYEWVFFLPFFFCFVAPSLAFRLFLSFNVNGVAKSHEAFIHMDYLVWNWKFNVINNVCLWPEGLKYISTTVSNIAYNVCVCVCVFFPFYLTDDIDLACIASIDNKCRKMLKIDIKIHHTKNDNAMTFSMKCK